MLLEINQDQFKTWLEVKGLSKKSIVKYMEGFKTFDMDVTYPRLLSFLKNHNNSIARAFVSNLFLYIRTSNVYPDDVKHYVAGLVVPRITGRTKRIVPDIMNESEILELSNAMDGERNRLMVLIQFYGGLRVSELCGIVAWDWNWRYWTLHPEESGKLKLKYGVKGNKQRVVYTPQRVMRRLYRFIKEQSGTSDKESFLFRIKSNTYAKLLHRASEKLVLNRNVKTHLLRHSCANWLRDNHWDLIEIKEYLGHEDISTTQRYQQTSDIKLKSKFDGLVTKI